MQIKKEALNSKSIWGDLPLLCGIFLLAVFLRLVYLYQFQASPFFDSPIIDALSHYLYAKRMAAGDWLIKGLVAPRVPLYVYFLAGLFKIFGTGFFLPRLAQMFLGALNCILAYLIGKKVFDRKVGLLAAFLMSVHGVLIYFDAEFLSVGLTIFGNSLLLLWIISIAGSNRLWKWLVCGLLLGVCMQISANIILFLPLLLIWIFFFNQDHEAFLNIRRKILLMTCVAIGFFCALLPFALRNLFQGGEFMLLSSTAGINFYIGNNPLADGKSALSPTRDFSYSGWEDNVLISSEKGAMRALGAGVKPSQVSRYWLGQGLKFMITDPIRAAGLVMRKFYYFFSAYEIPENQSIYFARVWSSLLSLLVFSNRVMSFPFGIILPLAILGMAISFSRDKKIILIGLFILAHLLLVMIFFSCSRYRAPVIPYFTMFAACGLCWIFDLRQRKSIKSLLLTGAALILIFVFVNANIFNAREDDRSQWFFKLGVALNNKGQTGRALKAFQSALNLNAKNVDALYNVAVIYLEKGEYVQAIENLRRVIEIDPNDSAAYANIGLAFARNKQPQEAIAYYAQALRIDPEDYGAMLNQAAAYDDLGEPEKSLELIARILKINPRFAPVYNLQGIIYEQMSRQSEAEAAYLKAIEINSQYFEAYYNLADFYEKAGLVDKARPYREKAAELFPVKE